MRRKTTWVAGIVLLALVPVTSAGGPYDLPLCQRIDEDMERDPAVKTAQLAHCDKVEEAYRAFIDEAAANGENLDEAYFFAMLFMTTAHWQKLADIEIAILACGDGVCDEIEDHDSCPADCEDDSAGPGAPGGGA